MSEIELEQLGQELPDHVVTAFNYAVDSENKIHDDEVALRFGFRGGLVPGVAMWAYLSRPAIEAWGRRFLEGGEMRARFLQPTYDGDPVTAKAVVAGLDPVLLELELQDSAGARCAVGQAGLLVDQPVDPAQYSWAPLPAVEDRPPASLESLCEGGVLGSLDVEGLVEADMAALVDRYRDDHPAYAGSADERPWLHPAWVLDKANTLLSSNVRLGPWIHTGSEVRYLGAPDWRRPLSLRGRVKEAYERKGHEIVVLDLGLLGGDDCVYAQVEHTAIVRPRQ